MAKLTSHGTFLLIGTFALVFMFYLWIGPRLIKKPVGTPPRSGSNDEAQQVAQSVAASTPPAAAAPGVTTPPLGIGAPSLTLPSTPTSLPKLRLGQAYAAARRIYPLATVHQA
jgi:hypothetical protein